MSQIVVGVLHKWIFFVHKRARSKIMTKEQNRARGDELHVVDGRHLESVVETTLLLSGEQQIWNESVIPR